MWTLRSDAHNCWEYMSSRSGGRLSNNCKKVILKHPAWLVTKDWMLSVWMYGYFKLPFSPTDSATVLTMYSTSQYMSKTFLLACTCRHVSVFTDYCLWHQAIQVHCCRQLIAWCWGWLGRSVWVVLPSGVVNKIRTKFPSESYVGFKYPQTS